MTLLGSGLCRKDDVVLQVADCSFDLHLRDVYCFLSFGGHVVTVPAQALSDMDLLTELFYRHQVCCALPRSARWASLDSHPPPPTLSSLPPLHMNIWEQQSPVPALSDCPRGAQVALHRAQRPLRCRSEGSGVWLVSHPHVGGGQGGRGTIGRR